MNFICMPNGHAAESDMESIRVGIYDNPPKVFLDDAGRPTGFWPELTREIAAREGMDIEWVHGSWAEGLRRLADNDIDVMVDTGLTEPRRERFTFGNETVHVSWSRIYAARGVEIETIPDLDGKRLGGLAGSFNLEGPGGLGEIVDRFALESQIVPMRTYEDLFEALDSGLLDAGVTNRDFGNRMESRYDVQRTPIIFQPAELRYAFTKGATRSAALAEAFDRQVDALKADRTSVLYALQAEWLGRGASGFRETVPDWLYRTLIALMAAVALLLVMSVAIEFRVRARTRQLQVERAKLKDNRDMLAESQRIASVGSWRVDEDGEHQDWSNEACRILGVSKNTFTPTTRAFLEMIHPDDRERFQEEREAVLAGRKRHDIEFRIVRPDGEVRHVRELGRLAVDAYTGSTVFAGTIQDVSEQKLVELELARQFRTRGVLINTLPAQIALLDSEGNVLEVNEQWRQFNDETPCTEPKPEIGENYFEACARLTGEGEVDGERAAASVRAVLEGARPNFAAEYSCEATDGTRWFRMTVDSLSGTDGDDTVHGAVVMHIDTTDRKRVEQELNRLAYEDPLTGLATSNGFVEKLGEELERTGWQADALVAMVRMRNLHDINEAHGYATGNRVLQTIAERIRRDLPDGAIAGRPGGDEFVIFVPEMDAAAAEYNRDVLAAAFSRPVPVDGFSVVVIADFGYTRFGHTHRPAEELMREAAVARFRGRSSGQGGTWHSYTPELDREIRERVSLARDLQRALDAEEFQLHYQPKVRLETGEVMAAEALIRWNHPERGLQSPATFIPVAEQSQLIAPIGTWVLREACRQMHEWGGSGLPDVRVAVNVSLVQFSTGDFASEVRDVLDAFAIAPHRLTLEITENIFAHESDELRRQVRKLNELGVHLSLDDFGTGYSSLLYLQRYPFAEIKLDQGFVRNMLDDAYSARIVRIVIEAGSALEASIVAEGVETLEIRDALLAQGCRIAQGYYFSMPLTAEDFTSLIRDGEPLPLMSSAAN